MDIAYDDYASGGSGVEEENYTEDHNSDGGRQSEEPVDGNNGWEKPGKNREIRLVNDYFREVGYEPMLSPREELELAAKLNECRTKAKAARKAISSILTFATGRIHPDNTDELKAAVRRKSFGNNLDQPDHDRLRKLTILLESYEKSAERLKKRFVNANLRLVASMAKSYVGRGVPFLDIIQEGNMGLMKAVDKFDHKKGYRFSTYASWWINQAMTRGVYNQNKTVKIPAYVLEKSGKVWRERAKFMKNNGRPPEPAEISEKVSMSSANVKHVLEYNNVNNMVRLDAPVWEGEKATFMDFIEDSETQPVDSLMAEVSIPRNVKEALQKLEERQRQIIRMRFGIGYPGTFTLDEIGRKFGLNRERIRQVERKALDAIRNSDSAPALKSLLEVN